MNKKKYNDKFLNFRIFISKMSTFSIAFVFGFLGILFMAIGASVVDKPSTLMSVEIRDSLIFTCAFLSWSIMGIVFIVRQEVPPILILHIQGIPAIIFGILWIIGCFYLISLPIRWLFR